MASRALVLGGGGVTGVAWEIGVLAGLAARGVRLAEADLLVGTSAGSVVGAQLACGADLEQLYTEQLEPPAAAMAPADKMKLRDMAIFGWVMLRYREPARAAARIGRMALAARTMPEARRRAVIAARVPRDEWPGQRLLITAVDAVTGELTAFDAASGACGARASRGGAGPGRGGLERLGRPVG